jgi:hypothetical protein
LKNTLHRFYLLHTSAFYTWLLKLAAAKEAQKNYTQFLAFALVALIISKAIEHKKADA